MPDLQINIKTKAELQGAEAALRALEADIGKAKALGQSYADLERRAAHARQVIAGFHTAAAGEGAAKKSWLGGMKDELAAVVPGFGRLTEVMGRIGSGAAGAIGVALGGIASSLFAARSAIEEFAGAERATARFDAALAASGQLTDAYREKLLALAESLKARTGLDDESWLGVLTKLTQMGASTSNIDGAAKAVENLAGLLGGNLEAAAMAVGKALQGSFESFSHLGIKLEETATNSEKLAKLFGELERRGGGQLAAMATTLSGRWQTLKNDAGDLVKGLGAWISQTGVLQSALEVAGNTVRWWADLLSLPIPKLDDLKNAQAQAAKTAGELADLESKHARAIEAEARATEAAVKATEDQVKVLREKQKMLDEADDAEMAYQLALIDRAQKTGQLNEVQATQARAATRQKFDEAKQNRELDAISQEREAKSAGLSDLADRKSKLSLAVGIDEKGLATARAYEAQALDAQHAGNAVKWYQNEIATRQSKAAQLRRDAPGLGEYQAAELLKDIPGLESKLGTAQAVAQTRAAKLAALPKPERSAAEWEVLKAADTRALAEFDKAQGPVMDTLRKDYYDLGASGDARRGVFATRNKTSAVSAGNEVFDAATKQAASQFQQIQSGHGGQQLMQAQAQYHQAVLNNWQTLAAQVQQMRAEMQRMDIRNKELRNR